MRYSIITFLLHFLTFASLYAVGTTQQRTITKIMLHDNTRLDLIGNSGLANNKDDVVFILEFETVQQNLDSTDFSLKTLTIQQTTQYKQLVLQDFTVDKTQIIPTPFGNITLAQDEMLNHAYIKLDPNLPIQSGILILHDKKLYLLCLDKTDVVLNNNTPLRQDSNLILHDSAYEVNSWRYFLVLGVMIAILTLLYVIKLRQNRDIRASNIVLEQAKILDSKNKVALIRYGEKRYLVGINPYGITLLDSMHCENHTEKVSDIESNPQHKDTQQQSFMWLFSKRQ